MDVAIGTRLREGPWGGGNQFVASLAAYLRGQGHEVRFALDAPDVEVILLTEPRRSSASGTFNDADIWRYLARVNPRALVVHRVNECDERKNTRTMNRRLALANRCADHTVFISSWLRDLFRGHGYVFAEASVIHNGANPAVFHPQPGPGWDGQSKLRIVTHHWSDNWMKGFDIYHRLDALLTQSPFSDRFAFTYIGRVPPEAGFLRVTVVPPLGGRELGDALGCHDAYLTASMNEPAGMHHIEAALCGLPLLYRLSGALPEYCSDFGLGFDDTTFETRLLELPVRYGDLRARLAAYPYTALTMCRAYEALFEDLLTRRDDIVARRRLTTGRARLFAVEAELIDRWDAWS